MVLFRKLKNKTQRETTTTKISKLNPRNSVSKRKKEARIENTENEQTNKQKRMVLFTQNKFREETPKQMIHCVALPLTAMTSEETNHRGSHSRTGERIVGGVLITS
jgi:hypothetical protein